jgi:hypothetical protein
MRKPRKKYLKRQVINLVVAGEAIGTLTVRCFWWRRFLKKVENKA